MFHLRLSARIRLHHSHSSGFRTDKNLAAFCEIPAASTYLILGYEKSKISAQKMKIGGLKIPSDSPKSMPGFSGIRTRGRLIQESCHP
jgi:hypothetical protein